MATKYIDEFTGVSDFSPVIIALRRKLCRIVIDETIPLASLKEAITSLVPLVPELEKMIAMLNKARSIRTDSLTIDESGAISLYTLKWKPNDRSFHVMLNTTLQTGSETSLQPWLLYLKLIMTALAKLRSDSTRLIVYHPVQLNLIAQYPRGRTFVWWSFTLCTVSADKLNNEYILGQTGPRTLFIIDCHSGINIREHSFYPKEEEGDVLLPPACQFQVIGCFHAGNGLHIIHLKELNSSDFLLKSDPLVSTIAFKTDSKSDPLQLPPIVSRPKVRFDEPLVTNQSRRKQNLKPTNEPKTITKSRTTFPKNIDPKVRKCIEALESDPKFTTLDLSWKQIGDQEVGILAKALEQNQTLITLNLHHNRIGPQGAQYLANTLKQNTTLTVINLEGNQMSDQGAQYLANALQQNKTLTTLDLGSNQIRPQGAQHLANALGQNRTLTTIKLRSNLISNLGARYLAHALQRNETLIRLDLESNQIGSQGAQYLTTSLQKNRTLTVLNLEGNSIGNEAKRQIMETLKRSSMTSHP